MSDTLLFTPPAYDEIIRRLATVMYDHHALSLYQLIAARLNHDVVPQGLYMAFALSAYEWQKGNDMPPMMFHVAVATFPDWAAALVIDNPPFLEAFNIWADKQATKP